MWESCYAPREIDQNETEIFPWRSPSPDSRRITAYLSPPLSISTKRRSFTYDSNKAAVIGTSAKQHKEILQAYHRQDPHVFTAGMNATPLYASIPSGIPIEGSTYRGPSDYPDHQQGTSYQSHYLQHHPMDEQHTGHGISMSAPDATEAWNMQQHQQQHQSRAPNWMYPGSIGEQSSSLSGIISWSSHHADRRDLCRTLSCGTRSRHHQPERLDDSLPKRRDGRRVDQGGKGWSGSMLPRKTNIIDNDLNRSASSAKGAKSTSAAGLEEEADGAYTQCKSRSSRHDGHIADHLVSTTLIS